MVPYLLKTKGEIADNHLHLSEGMTKEKHEMLNEVTGIRRAITANLRDIAFMRSIVDDYSSYGQVHTPSLNKKIIRRSEEGEAIIDGSMNLILDPGNQILDNGSFIVSAYTLPPGGIRLAGGIATSRVCHNNGINTIFIVHNGGKLTFYMRGIGQGVFDPLVDVLTEEFRADGGGHNGKNPVLHYTINSPHLDKIYHDILERTINVCDNRPSLQDFLHNSGFGLYIF